MPDGRVQLRFFEKINNRLNKKVEWLIYAPESSMHLPATSWALVCLLGVALAGQDYFVPPTAPGIIKIFRGILKLLIDT